MEIKIYEWTDRRDELQRQQMIINGSVDLYVGPLCECPEDAIIGRDLVDCDQVLRYMKLAFEAAKNNEIFDVEFIEGNPDDVRETL